MNNFNGFSKTQRLKHLKPWSWAAFALCFVFLLACKETKEDQPTAQSETAKQETETSQQQTETAASDLSVPIYKFEEFEPLLNQDDGATYVVNFWATWCKPCIKELPYFETVAQKYADQNVKVLLVSMDFPRLLEKQVIPFIEKNGLKSPVVLLDDTGANEWIPKVDESWSGAIPATVIYKGDERKFFERSFTLEELEKEINTFL